MRRKSKTYSGVPIRLAHIALANLSVTGSPHKQTPRSCCWYGRPALRLSPQPSRPSGGFELPSELLRDSMKRDSTQPIILTDDLTKWRSAPAFVNSGILVPLSTNTADPIRLQPLKLTPIK